MRPDNNKVPNTKHLGRWRLPQIFELEENFMVNVEEMFSEGPGYDENARAQEVWEFQIEHLEEDLKVHLEELPEKKDSTKKSYQYTTTSRFMKIW